MYHKVAAKLDSGETPTMADRIYLHLAVRYPEISEVVVVHYIGQRAQRSTDWYFEVRRSGGKIIVRAAFEVYHPRFEEIMGRLIEAIRELRSTATNAKLLRMRIPSAPKGQSE